MCVLNATFNKGLMKFMKKLALQRQINSWHQVIIVEVPWNGNHVCDFLVYMPVQLCCELNICGFALSHEVDKFPRWFKKDTLNY